MEKKSLENSKKSMDESKYVLKITPKASADLNEIYDYIANSLVNESAAKNLMSRIEEKIMRLKDFPFSCSCVTDEILKEKGYHKLIIESYIAFYIVNEEEKQVIIIRVLYGRQKYQDII